MDIMGGLQEAQPTWRLHLIVPDEGPLARRARLLGVDVVVQRLDSGVARLGDATVTLAGIPRLLWRVIRVFPRLVTAALGLRRAISRCAPDIVHAHGFKMQILAMWVRPASVPVVLHLHDYIGHRRVMSHLLRLPFRGAVVAAAISESVAQDAVRTTRGRLPTRVVYNGIDIAHWSPIGAVADLDNLSGLPPAPLGTVRVGLVATLARWKGHEVFLAALRDNNTTTPVRGYVNGGSINRTDRRQYYLRELRHTASRLGIERSTGFTGFVADPASAMRALDIVVHASTLPEPFGRVVVEGMATERAVISTATGGSAELIEDGVSAVAVAPGDAAALARAIASLVEDAPLRRTMGREGRCRVQRLFGREAMTTSLVALYTSTIDAQRIAS